VPTRAQILKSGTPLALALPGCRFASRHGAVIDAPPELVWSVLHELRWVDLRVSLVLCAVRGLGGRSAGRRRLVDPPGPMTPIQQQPSRYLCSGQIGKPWTPRPVTGPAMQDLDGLRAFTEPGWLKYGMEWTLTPLPGGRTFVETATLCEPTDEAAARRFAAYWQGIRVFSGLIRRDILAALQRRVRCAG